jgi:hypothetical protein
MRYLLKFFTAWLSYFCADADRKVAWEGKELESHMDTAEARQLLRDQLALYRARSYAELTQLLNEQQVVRSPGNPESAIKSRFRRSGTPDALGIFTSSGQLMTAAGEHSCL